MLVITPSTFLGSDWSPSLGRKSIPGEPIPKPDGHLGISWEATYDGVTICCAPCPLKAAAMALEWATPDPPEAPSPGNADAGRSGSADGNVEGERVAAGNVGAGEDTRGAVGVTAIRTRRSAGEKQP